MSMLMSDESRFIGGLRERRGNASIPLACMKITADGVCIAPAWSWLRLFIPTYFFPWKMVREVRSVRGITAPVGIQFVLYEPIPAVQRKGLARLWPDHATAPVFWVRRRDLDYVRQTLRRPIVPGGRIVWW
jgi:hypothetical protein